MSITIYNCNFRESTGLWERGPRGKCVVEPRENTPLLNVCFASWDRDQMRCDAYDGKCDSLWTSTTDMKPITTLHNL